MKASGSWGYGSENLSRPREVCLRERIYVYYSAASVASYVKSLAQRLVRAK